MHIYKITLGPLQMWSEEAEGCLLVIAAHESLMGKHLKQVPAGPARGVHGVEINTMVDNYDNWINYRPSLRRSIAHITGVDGPCRESLTYNPIYNTMHARLKLWRAPGKIPTSLYGQATYVKEHYNTADGKGTVWRYIDDYLRYCSNQKS